MLRIQSKRVPYQKRLFNLAALLILTVQVSLAQISMLSLQESTNLSYKKALKKAKETNAPVLVILYSPSVPVHSSNQFVDAKNIIERAGAVPVVVDWVNRLNQQPQKRIHDVKNPMWLYVHPADIIINGKIEIQTDAELQEFLSENKILFDELDMAVSKHETSKSKSDLLDLIKVSSKTVDGNYTSKRLNDYLKRAVPKDYNNENLKDIIQVASIHPVSKRVYRVLKDRKKRAIALTSADTIYSIFRANILNELEINDMLYPYDVWQRYEKELDFKADSLYRIFAIQHFSKRELDPQAVYNESFDFINLYPRADWSLLDPLYNVIVPNTTKKEDLELLLDLISFQIFREESYRQLDYKAMILYKLGEKERALGMISQINSLATKKKVRYKSMLYNMKK